MDLETYFKENLIQKSAFADKIGVSVATINNILKGRRDLYLSVAIKIEHLTNGKVKCMDLLPERFKKEILTGLKGTKTTKKKSQ